MTVQTTSKAVVADALRRVGLAPDLIREVLAPLPDPVDLDKYSDELIRYGITRDQLMSRMGGSP